MKNAEEHLIEKVAMIITKIKKNDCVPVVYNTDVAQKSILEKLDLMEIERKELKKKMKIY